MTRHRGVDTDLGQAGTCGECAAAMPDGPDACLGTIPGVSHACCGHGGACEPYVVLGGTPGQPAWQVPTVTLRGPSALAFFDLVRAGEWEPAEP